MCIWKSGKNYKGEWKNNKINGKGIFNWPDNKYYEGFFFFLNNLNEL